MKLIKSCIIALLCILSVSEITAQNAQLCVEAEISVREGDVVVTCEPGAPMLIRFKTSKNNTPYAYVITDEAGTMLRISISDKVSFANLPGGDLRVYGFGYIGNVLAQEGENIFTSELASICAVITTNYIGVENIVPEGGLVQSTNGRTIEYICTSDDLADIISFENNVDEPIYAYVITDDNNNILGTSLDGSADFSNAPTGICRVWGIAYTGALLSQEGDNLLATEQAEGCYDISDNYVTVIRTEPEGAGITANGAIEDIDACDYPNGDGFPIVLANSNDQTFSYGYLLSDEAETNFTVVEGNVLNISDLPKGKSRVRGISYAGQISSGPDFATDQTGCFSLSENFITLNRIYVEGGEIAFADGSTAVRACGLDDVSDQFNFQTNTTAQEDYAWVLTDDQNIIKTVSSENLITIDGFEGEDNFRVYGLSYSGTILPADGASVSEALLVEGCFELSDNFVTITRIRPDGGDVSVADGSTNFSACDSPNTAEETPISLSNTGKVGFAYTYLLTDTDNNILQIINEEAIPLSSLPSGISRLWGVSYEGVLTAKVGDSLNSTLVDGCFDLSNNFATLDRILVDGGSISLQGGGTEAIACGTDGISDQYSFEYSSSAQENYAYILSDDQGIIKGVFTANSINLDEFTENDDFQVWGLSYKGTLLPVVGQDLNSAVLVEGCAELSANFISIGVTRPDGGDVTLPNGGTEFFGCASPDTAGEAAVQLSNTGKAGFAYTYLIADANNIILQITDKDTILLSELPENASRIWGISYQGTIPSPLGLNVYTPSLVDGCADLSGSFVSLSITTIDGGDLFIFNDGVNGGTDALICGNDDIPDAFTFNSNTIAADASYILIVTDENNRVFSTANGGIIDFDLFLAGTYRIWGLSFSGTPTVPFGSIVTDINLSTECYDLSNNFVTIRQEEVNGGQLQFTGGATEIFTCPGDGQSDVLSFVNNGFTSDSYVYLITDANNAILATTAASNFDFETSPPGNCRIWGLAYSGELNAPVGAQLNETILSNECYTLSDNFLSVVREVPTAGSVSLADGSDLVFTCPGDGLSDFVSFSTTSTYSGQYLYLVTHEDNRVIDISFTGTYDFGFADPGNCRVWGVAFTGDWLIQQGDLITEEMLSSDCWAITENFVTVIREVPSAGILAFNDGSTTQYTCPGDGKADLKTFTNNSIYPGNYLYLITDENNIIVDSTSEDSFDFETINLETCRVWGVAYTGNLLFKNGDNAVFVNISDDCFDVSNNFITVIRDNPDGGVISNATGNNVTFCVGDAFADLVDLSVSGASNSLYAYLITDEAGNLINITDSANPDFNNAPSGICRIYSLAYTGTLSILPGENIQVVPITDDCYGLSENFITLNRIDVDGGTISTSSGSTDVEFICSGDGTPDVVTFQNDNADTQVSYQYILTSSENIIIGDLNDGMLDFEGSPFDTLRVYGTAYLGTSSLPIGTDITTAVLSDSCYDISSNFINIINDLPDGGTISTADGQSSILVCIGGSSGLVEMASATPSLSGYTYLITTPDFVIVGAATGNVVDFNPLEPGNYLIHGLSYTGQLTFELGDNASTTTLSSSCFELSSNVVQAERAAPLDGGTVLSPFGDPIFACLNDGIADLAAFETTSTDSDYRYVITDTLNNIIIPDVVGNVIDFDKANPGFCRVYGVSITGNYIGTFGTNILEDPLSDRCSAVSSNFISLVKANIDGGTVATEGGATFVVLKLGDDLSDVVAFDSTDASGVSYAYIVADENDAILNIANGDRYDFKDAVEGICRVYGIAYSGELLAQAGDTIGVATLSSGCFDVSDNFVTISHTSDGVPLVENPEESTELVRGLQLHIYPNPVSVSLNLQIQALKEQIDVNGLALIEVFDISGYRRISKQQDLSQVKSLFELNVQELPIGMYIVRISNGDARVQQRFFKQ